MRTTCIKYFYLALPFLFVGCAAFQKGADGSPSPVSEGVDAAGKSIIDAVASGNINWVSVGIGALIAGLTAGGAAYYKNKKAKKPQ